jgi:hypothetical protein
LHIIDDAPTERGTDVGYTGIDKRATYEPFVIINASDFAAQNEQLHAIRSDLDSFLTPAFLLHAESDEARVLGDGRVSDVEQAGERAGRIARRIASLSTLQSPVDDTDRLLRFLYTRVDFELRPIRDWKHAQTYRYPLLDVLGEFQTDSRSWLSALEKNDFIEPLPGIVDRIRHCPGCDSTHVNYVDQCPACESLQIAAANLLHCFACGYVAQEGFFDATDGRRCPKCARALRHIGVDYDRALQNSTCGDCAASFSDARVRARCLNCDRQFDPAQLRARNVRSWRLTRAGRIAALGGAGTAPPSGSLASIVSDGRFTELVDWAQRTRRRYDAARYGLICIRLQRDESPHESGNDGDCELLPSLLQRFRESVRGTEVVGAGAWNSLWIYCPHSDAAALVTIRQRIMSLGEAIDDGIGGSTRLLVSLAHSDDVPIAERADTLLERVARSLRRQTT